MPKLGSHVYLSIDHFEYDSLQKVFYGPSKLLVAVSLSFSVDDIDELPENVTIWGKTKNVEFKFYGDRKYKSALLGYSIITGKEYWIYKTPYWPYTTDEYAIAFYT